jgi:transposase InsO family protein
MNVSKSSYYHWLTRVSLPKERSPKTILMDRILSIFNESRQVYGSVRIQKMLEREGLKYSRSYVAILMRELGIKSVLRRKYVITTDSKHHFSLAENILNREFTTTEIGTKWVSDITYIQVNESWNYLTTIIDLADRKIVGWSLSEDMTTDNTVFKAWVNARNNREIKEGFIFHSDRGVQYAAHKMKNLFLFNKKITQSMSRKGNCWDNAVAESFFKTIKHECLLRYKFNSIDELYDCINEYINWYNTMRIHSSLNYLTPLEKELELKKLFKNVA